MSDVSCCNASTKLLGLNTQHIPNVFPRNLGRDILGICVANKVEFVVICVVAYISTEVH